MISGLENIDDEDKTQDITVVVWEVGFKSKLEAIFLSFIDFGDL